MIVELVDAISTQGPNNEISAYQRTLFPEPATKGKLLVVVKA